MKTLLLILVVSILLTFIILSLPKMVIINIMLLSLTVMSFLPFYLLRV